MAGGGGLPKARHVLKADAAFRAVVGLGLLAGPLYAGPGVAGLATQGAGVLALGWAVVLATIVAAGAPATRVVVGGNALASLGGVAVVVGWMGSDTLGGGFVASGLLAVLALGLLGFGVMSGLYWGRLRQAAR